MTDQRHDEGQDRAILALNAASVVQAIMIAALAGWGAWISAGILDLSEQMAVTLERQRALVETVNRIDAEGSRYLRSRERDYLRQQALRHQRGQDTRL